MVHNGTVGAYKSHILLVIWMHRDLKETQVSIQATKEEMPSYALQHEINKGKGEVVLLGGSIELSVIDTHSSLVTIFIEMTSFFSFLKTVIPPFWWPTGSGLTQSLFEIGWMRLVSSSLTTSFLIVFSILFFKRH